MSSTSRGAVRSDLDFYETQPEDSRPMIAKLLPLFGPRPGIFEPTAGRGALVRELRAAWPEATITANELDPDRASHLKAAGATHVIVGDLFKCQAHAFDLAFTNPPFVCADRVVEHCLEVAKHVVILQRINFLASLDRLPFWLKNPADFHILPRRPSFAASLQCGRVDAKGRKASCGWKLVQFLDSPRPKDCPGCQAKVLCSTTDSCEYAWFHFYAGSLRQFGHLGAAPQPQQGQLSL